MKQEINYSRYVDRYLDGVMSPEEVDWFEKELDNNPGLYNEMDLQRKIHLAITSQELIDLEAQLDTIYKDNYRTFSKIAHIPQKTRRIIAFSGAAAIVIAIIGFVAANLFRASTSEAELYAAYYKPAEINLSFRSAEDMVDSDLRSAMALYEQQEYAKAINLFEKILEGDESRIGLNLYSGISYMEIQEYALANSKFRKIIDHKANAFLESAEWYLGLCYLMTSEKEKAEEIFREIASGSGYYRKEAKRILKMID